MEDEDIAEARTGDEKEKWMPIEMRKPRIRYKVEALKELYKAKRKRTIRGRLKRRLVPVLALLQAHKALDMWAGSIDHLEMAGRRP